MHTYKELDTPYSLWIKCQHGDDTILVTHDGDHHVMPKCGCKIPVDKKIEAPVAERHNSGKVDLTFNPTKASIAQARVWMYGAKKYARDQWRKLWAEDTINVAMASALRHMEKIKEGEYVDEESGCLHAAHVICNMAMIIEYLDREGIFKVE